MSHDLLFVPSDVHDGSPISPTDISQFIRLDQCERYLRLRLHERTAGPSFMNDYGVVPQSIPPLLTRSGERFEERIETLVDARYPFLILTLLTSSASMGLFVNVAERPM